MAVTRVVLSVLRGRIIAAANLAPSAAWTTTLATAGSDPRFNDTELDNSILAADALVCRARAATLGDGYRSLFLADSGSIAHGAKLPDHLGPVEQITIKYSSADSTYRAGKFDRDLTLSDIENWREFGAALYGGAHDLGVAISGFYIIEGDVLFYTGSDAKCLIANVTRTGACQAPETDENIVFGLSLGSLLKEGMEGPFLSSTVADARALFAEIPGSQLIVQPQQVAQAA